MSDKNESAPPRVEGDTFIVTIDASEVAIRIIEGITDEPRPEGISAKECLNAFLDKNPEMSGPLHRAALKVVEYFAAQTNGKLIKQDEPEAPAPGMKWQ